MYYMDRDRRMCLPNSKTPWQERICVDREVSKEILPVTDREWDFSGINEHIHLDIIKQKTQFSGCAKNHRDTVLIIKEEQNPFLQAYSL